MRTIFFILQKEFLQVFRNRAMLPIIFVMPVIQLLILAFAANYEIKNIRIDIVDQDRSSWSQRLTHKMLASGYFELNEASLSVKAAYEHLAQDKADLILVIPPDFERNLVRQDKTSLQLLVNAINGSKAGLANGYATNIIRSFNKEVRVEWLAMDESNGPPRIDVTYSNWFNQEMNYKYFMVPGILVVLVTMIGAFLSGMNIVKEKEIGTVEQLNVTPIRKHHFIIGKLLPFWIIALFELAFGLLLGKLIFHLPMEGSLLWVFLFAAVPYSDAGYGFAHFHLYRYAAAGHVHYLVLHYHFRTYERAIYARGKHARLGAKNHLVQPHHLFRKGNPHGNVEGQRLGAYQTLLPCYVRLCRSVKRHRGMELQENSLSRTVVGKHQARVVVPGLRQNYQAAKKNLMPFRKFVFWCY
jgi:ABC-2 type transport system permease protein